MERLDTNESTELLITSYFNIVKRTMIDMVPKAIMYTLVQYVSYALPTYPPLTLFQVHQGRDAARAPREHVPQQRAGRPAEGKRLHGPPAERVPADGGEPFPGQRDRQPGSIRDGVVGWLVLIYTPGCVPVQ